MKKNLRVCLISMMKTMRMMKMIVRPKKETSSRLLSICNFHIILPNFYLNSLINLVIKLRRLKLLIAMVFILMYLKSLISVVDLLLQVIIKRLK